MKPIRILQKDYILELKQRFAQIKSTLLKGAFRKDFIIGLDIGTSSVKLAQFLRREDGLHLIRVDSKGLKRADNDAAWEKEAVSVLSGMLRGIDLKDSRFILAINCPMTSIKRITAPYMPRQELRKGILMETKNYFPFPIDKAFLDFQIIGDVVEKGIKRYAVAVAASPMMTVNKYLKILNKAGIESDLFIPCSHALAKVAERMPSKAGKAYCFLDIGEKYSELLVFKDKKLVFARKIPVAGGDFTKALTSALVSDKGKILLSLDEAEALKRKTGIPDESDSGMIDEKISATQVSSLLRSPLEHLVNEIDRCFGYYREESGGGGGIDSLILFGAGALLKGLAGYLSEELGIDVRMGDAFAGLRVEGPALKNKDALVCLSAPAIGAGLSDVRGINLLPPEIKEETRRTVRRSGFEAAAIALVLILSFIYINMRIQLGNFNKRISVVRMELSSLDAHLGDTRPQVLTNKILSDEPYWEDVFKELSNVIPDNIYLTALNKKADIITMRGIVASRDPEEELSAFMLALERGIFKDVNLALSRVIKEKSVNEFELNCWLD